MEFKKSKGLNQQKETNFVQKHVLFITFASEYNSNVFHFQNTLICLQLLEETVFLLKVISSYADLTSLV